MEADEILVVLPYRGEVDHAFAFDRPLLPVLRKAREVAKLIKIFVEVASLCVIIKKDGEQVIAGQPIKFVLDFFCPLDFTRKYVKFELGYNAAKLDTMQLSLDILNIIGKLTFRDAARKATLSGDE